MNRGMALSTGGHSGRLQRPVLRGASLLELGLVLTFYTIVIQALSQRILSPLHKYGTEEVFCPKTMVKKARGKKYSDKKIKKRPKGP